MREIAKDLEIKQFDKLKKQDLIYQILDEQAVKPVKGQVKVDAPKAEAPAKPRNTRKSAEPK
ncbi:MAG: Rho termination factor N-terminal domain-containing protein, partial [Flavobacteriales bacterium]|nr:Rho termination factor N-terminal domain-containing protein [Flavobacteriales bacterium]